MNSLTLYTEISAASVVIQYWNGAEHINAAAWITIIILVVVCLNVFAVAVYGEAEFVFASIKIIAIIGLLLFAFIVDLGGGPTKDRLGFRYWKHPGAMKAYVGDGSAGRFLGFFSTLVNAAFAYGGVEMVAVAAGEAENPRKVCLLESSCSFSTGLWVIDHFLRASTVTPVHYRNNLIADFVAYRTYQRLSDESSGGFCSSMFSVLLPLVS